MVLYRKYRLQTLSSQKNTYIHTHTHTHTQNTEKTKAKRVFTSFMQTVHQ